MTFINNPTPKYLLCGLCVLLSNLAAAQQPTTAAVQAELSLKPAKCVSLRQGQVCYADVTLEWRVSQSGNYCLLSSTQPAPLLCWEGKHQGEYVGELASDSNITFSLVQQDSSHTLARAEMKMAWVYKKRRSAVSWRVF